MSQALWYWFWKDTAAIYQQCIYKYSDDWLVYDHQQAYLCTGIDNYIANEFHITKKYVFDV